MHFEAKWQTSPMIRKTFNEIPMIDTDQTHMREPAFYIDDMEEGTVEATIQQIVG